MKIDKQYENPNLQIVPVEETIKKETNEDKLNKLHSIFGYTGNHHWSPFFWKRKSVN